MSFVSHTVKNGFPGSHGLSDEIDVTHEDEDIIIIGVSKR